MSVVRADRISGADPDTERRILVIACGALAHEIRDICTVNRLTHIDLTCLPANLHLYPQKIPDAVRDSIRAHRGQYDRILIGYGDCGTGGLLDTVLAEEGVTRIGGPHCYAFFSGLDAFAGNEDADFTSFFLTDFLVRHFDTFIIKPLGLDRHPELRDAYFGHYERVVYLAQTEDADLDAEARRAADRLGLVYERRMTGYGDLSGFLSEAEAESV